MLTPPGKYCQLCAQTSWHALMRLCPPPWSSGGLSCSLQALHCQGPTDPRSLHFLWNIPAYTFSSLWLICGL